MRSKPSVYLGFLCVLVLIVSACRQAPQVPVDPYSTPAPDNTPGGPRPAYTPVPDDTPVRLPPGYTPVPRASYLDRLSFAPQDARYYDLVKDTLNLTAKEQSLLERNGVLISDRLAFEDFTTAYGYIYWKDLPVVVTSDSILQSIHQSYDDILIYLESKVFVPRLVEFLSAVRDQVRADARANEDRALDALYRDIEIYVTVPLILLTGDTYDTAGVEPYVTLASEASEVKEVVLFGGEKRQIDFTLFSPRGHYTESPILERYFRAMLWLAQIDYRFVIYDPQTSEPCLQPEHLAAAVLLRDAVNRAGMRPSWDDLDALLVQFVGQSDNVSLPDLDRLLADAGIQDAGGALAADADVLLGLLTTIDYGYQRITGQLLERHVDNPSTEAMPRPVTFALMGQRFAIDSYAMSNLVYDRLMVGGEPVQRPLPSPMDVAYVLGNDRALDHLQDELDRYGYAEQLALLRAAVESYDPTFWSSTAYNRWLDVLRTLDVPTTGEAYPQAMRTAAWADKVLHTQLASWAQLRHDNILYVKQPVTMGGIACSYPDGYVEPYPEFYAAVARYAEVGGALFAGLEGLPDPEKHNQILTYFADLAEVAGCLQILAEKELALEPFTPEETQWLKSIVIRQDPGSLVCGVEPDYRDEWDGWYTWLFLEEEDSPLLIADVHTNPNNDRRVPNLYPSRVLHVGTGPVATMVFLVDTDEGPTAYVGPVFTYYEAIEEGFPPVRLNDQDWEGRFQGKYPPQPPQWTAGFRLPSTEPPRYMHVPYDAK